MKTLYHTSKTGAVVEWDIWTEGADIVTEYGQRDGKKQLARKTATGKNIGKTNETTPDGESWELVRHLPPSKDTWKFCVFDENNIQIFHNDVADNSKFANGLYRTAQARTKWDELVAKGYEVKQ